MHAVTDHLQYFSLHPKLALAIYSLQRNALCSFIKDAPHNTQLFIHPWINNVIAVQPPPIGVFSALTGYNSHAIAVLKPITTV